MKNFLFTSLFAATVLCGCSGGGSGRAEGEASADFGCDGSCPEQFLSVDEVRAIVGRGVGAATFLGVQANFAVLDRVGNVLAVYQMPGAAATTTISGQIGAAGGLEGVAVPSSLAAISKAGTGAYLSSQGNAFSTRTASQIIQEHFNPGESNQPGGPLFGVQFSQLLCSDVTVRQSDFAAALPAGVKPAFGGGIGPRPLPLGLSADPGGIPLYKAGELVGGIGVEFDGSYQLDRNIFDSDLDGEEIIALTAARNFEAPSERVAPNIFAGGKSLRYADVSYTYITEEVSVAELDPAGFPVIADFFGGQVRAGTPFGSVASGVAHTLRRGVPVSTLVGPDGQFRFPTRSGSSAQGVSGLSTAEVEALLDSALLTANRTRAAIRRPLDTAARVSIWVVDVAGNPLGFTRSLDAPVFGIDVALQKARTAAFFSSSDAAQVLQRARQTNSVGGFDDYVARGQALLGASAFADGKAFANRSIGNIARPFFLDGIADRSAGPFSLEFPGQGAARSWSPFNTGLQLDLVFQRLVAPLGVPSAPRVFPDSCTDRSVLGSRLANGIQIFPGAVPLYRNGILIGAIGVSGDGVDQDDLIAFYGASQPGLQFAGYTGLGDPELGFNAPLALRADVIELSQANARLRYVNCPEAPFIGSSQQNVCDGL